jgi:phospholipid/cholesterol/gamma-HCH transport system substrate-binding protein
LGGVDIGTVTGVGHGPDSNDDRLYVKVDVVSREAARVREDSVARVSNRGLLGDKMLELSAGTPGRPTLAPGSAIRSEDPADYTNLIGQVGDMAHKANAVLSNVEKATSTFADEGTRQDMRSSLQSISAILKNVAGGQGYIGRLVSDPAEADRFSHLVQNLDQTSARLNATLDNVDQILARVNRGPGFAHDLVYSTQGAEVLAHLGQVAEEAALTLRGVREGNGIAHGVIYGDPEQQQIMSSLGAASTDLREIMAGVRAGKGTVGGLLIDPSLYEDLKTVVGNVRRNEVLRALVRYSIKEDEKRAPINVAGEQTPRATMPQSPAAGPKP